MKFLLYIKYILPQIICFMVMVFLVDAILLSSTVIEKSFQDIVYLNLLLGIIMAAYAIYVFFSLMNRYGKLYKALEENSSIDYLLPEDDSFHSVLLRKAVQQKDSENIEIVRSYKSNMEELNNYITKWVHEIKLPISVTELMLENTEDLGIDTSRKYKTEMERIKFLVNQVLYAGRASQYQEDLTAAEFSLQKVVKEALKLNAYFLMSKNIEVNPHDLDFSIINDEKWVIYILEQILNNTSKYVGKDGKVEIFADESGKIVNLHIRDNGIGIPAKDMSRIFEKGFTGENGRKTSKSTGMGLYYSKKIADRIGIGLKVDSTYGEFTEFILTFSKSSDYHDIFQT